MTDLSYWRVRALRAETQLADMAREARSVMDALAEYGPSIVGHLLDSDDNAGERLRQLIAAALGDAVPTPTETS